MIARRTNRTVIRSHGRKVVGVGDQVTEIATGKNFEVTGLGRCGVHDVVYDGDRAIGLYGIRKVR